MDNKPALVGTHPKSREIARCVEPKQLKEVHIYGQDVTKAYKNIILLSLLRASSSSHY
jgi:hypothetical protein